MLALPSPKPILTREQQSTMRTMRHAFLEVHAKALCCVSLAAKQVEGLDDEVGGVGGNGGVGAGKDVAGAVDQLKLHVVAQVNDLREGGLGTDGLEVQLDAWERGSNARGRARRGHGIHPLDAEPHGERG